MRTSATYNRARMLARKNRQRNGASVLDGTESERAQRGPTDFSTFTFSTWSTWRSSLPVAKLVSETAATERQRLIINFQRKRWASERSRFALTPSAEQSDRMTSNERGSLLRSPLEAIAILTPSAEREREGESEREGN